MDRQSFKKCLEQGEFNDLEELSCQGDHVDDVIDPENSKTEDNKNGSTLKLDTITARDLQCTDFKDLRFIVDGLLPAGLNILASPPKYGKSWIVLALCLAVASGRPFLGYTTHRCGCLYLALEDSRVRLKNRLTKLLNGTNAPSDIHLCTTAHSLDNSLLTELEDFLSSHQNIGLIVIDTLQRIRGNARIKEGAYATDYREMSALKSFADTHNISVLLIHHLRKMKDEGDPFNMLSGTNGLMGSADTTIVLTKENRRDDITTMSITGRDIEGDEIVIQFNKSHCMWENLGDKDSYSENQAYFNYHNNTIVHIIKKLLERPPYSWTGSAKQFIEAGYEIAAAPLPSPRKLAENLKDLEGPLSKNDGIIWERSKNGSGGGKYTFRYLNNMEDNTVMQTQLVLPITDSKTVDTVDVI